MKLLLVLLFPLSIWGQSPRVFLLDAAKLKVLKTKVSRNDPSLKPAMDSLLNAADAYLPVKPWSVMTKGVTPPSGNKHDYMSQAPYFWYDSSKPNGLPYLRRDGVRNPEINKITDHTTLDNVNESTEILSLAWYLTGKEVYANKAAEIIKTCFLDEATKMNPNLDFGQGIPGINTGRGIGIIETRSLMHVADAAGLLEGSKAWSMANQQALQKWYGQYLDWLLTSKNGKEEHAAKNNHGTWYYAQVIDFALFSGNKQMALTLANESKKRLDSQLTKEGKQPLELERTNALGYSTMNIDGWFTVAKLAEKAGTDLWNYKGTSGVGFREALDWLMPYALGEKKFEYQQINKYNKSEIYPLLTQAGEKYKHTPYLEEARKLRSASHWMTDLIY